MEGGAKSAQEVRITPPVSHIIFFKKIKNKKLLEYCVNVPPLSLSLSLAHFFFPTFSFKKEKRTRNTATFFGDSQRVY